MEYPNVTLLEKDFGENSTIPVCLILSQSVPEGISIVVNVSFQSKSAEGEYKTRVAFNYMY